MVERVAIGLGLVAVLAGASPVVAQRDPLWPRFAASLGSYLSVNDTDVRVDLSSARGTEVDFESDFGVKDNFSLTSFKFDWSPWERHQFSIGYFDYDRSGHRRIDREVEIGDTTYPVGAEVSARFENQQIESSYTYWLVRKPTFGFGLSGGVVALTLTESASATVTAGNQTVTRAQDRDVLAPVPMIGAGVKGKPWAHTLLYAGVRGLPKVTIGDIEGEALTYSAGIEYYFLHDRLGVGAGYDANVFRVDVDQSSWKGKVKLSVEGWRFYGQFVF